MAFRPIIIGNESKKKHNKAVYARHDASQTRGEFGISNFARNSNTTDRKPYFEENRVGQLLYPIRPIQTKSGDMSPSIKVHCRLEHCDGPSPGDCLRPALKIYSVLLR